MSNRNVGLRSARPALLALLGLLLVSVTACGSAPQAHSSAKASPASAGQSAAHYIGHLTLEPANGLIGSRVHVAASGLPANTTFDLVWDTVKGAWVIQGQLGENFAGRAFTPVHQVLEQVQSDASGQVNASFTVPEGFGFDHTVSLTKGGAVENQALFVVKPEASLESTQGPPGSPIHITMQGIGAQSYTNNWMLLYDNKFTGWVSSVTTNGTAHITIPATGGPGKHVITIIHGAYTFPYLNTEQSPHPKPVFHLTYTVTSGSAVLPPALSQQGLPSQQGTAPSGTGKAAWVNPATGPVQTPLVVHARSLPAGQTVELKWQTVVGSRVTSAGWKTHTVVLGKATVAADGTLSFPFKAPEDLGGAHSISIVGSNGKVLATTKYTITPTAVGMSPTRGPDGTIFTLHLKGVGWTETANIYTLVYDNAYDGYVCGFNSQGDVVIHMAAAGSPGWHFIDLYPAIYKGTDIKGTDSFRLPQLTYALDHPGETLPAFHFAFYVTPSH